MSANSNLEVKVSELTDVIRDLSDKPTPTRADMRELLDNLIQKVQDTNTEGFDRLTDDLSRSLVNVLENKYDDIKERLSLFETFILSVEKTVQNPKIDAEVAQILNQIESLHSKMNSQELQTDGLMKSFEAVKNSSSNGQITKLCDDIVSISKSYDGIIDVLNNNFKEFLRRVEALSSREEFQRLRYVLEDIQNAQNILSTAIGAVGDKQEEIKNLIKNTSVQSPDKFEALQGVLNQMGAILTTLAAKGDIETVADKISALSSLFEEFKRNFGENDYRGVFQSQLNDIITRLEGIKLDSNSGVGEDIIRLYTSIADFKEGIYTSVSSQLREVVNSVDTQLNKISTSLSGVVLDSNETVNNLSNEVQKLGGIVSGGLNSKTAEINENVQKTVQETSINAVNAIKSDLAQFKNEVLSLDNSGMFNDLAAKIDSVQNSLDFNSIINKISELKESFSLEPVIERLSELNQADAINSLNQKIEFLLQNSKNTETINKIDELKGCFRVDEILGALEVVGQKISNIQADSSLKNQLESGLNNIVEGLNSVNSKLSDNSAFENLNSITNQIMNGISSLQNKLSDNSSFESLNGAAGEIINGISSLQNKLADNSAYENLNSAANEIMNGISSLQNKLSDNSSFESLNGALVEIAGRINVVDNRLENETQTRLEETNIILTEIADKISALDIKLTNGLNFQELNNEINTISEKIGLLNNNLNFAADFEGIAGGLNGINERINALGQSFDLTPDFEKVNENVGALNERLNSLDLKLDSILKKDEISPVLNEIKSMIDALRANPDKNIEFEELNAAFNSLTEKIGEIASKLDNSVSHDELNSLFGEINEKIDFLNSSQEHSEGDFEDLFGSLNELKDRLGLVDSRLNYNSKFDKIYDSIVELRSGVELIAAKPQGVSNARIDELKEAFERITECVNNLAAKPEPDFDLRFDEVGELISGVKEEVGKTNGAIESSHSGLLNEFSELVSKLEEKIEKTNVAAENSYSNLLNEISGALNEIKRQIELAANQKPVEITGGATEETGLYLNEIKDRIDTIELKVSDNSQFETGVQKLGEIEDKISTLELKINDSTKHEEINAALSGIEDKISIVDLKLADVGNARFDETNERIAVLLDFVKTLNTNQIAERLEGFEREILGSGIDNTREIQDRIGEFQRTINAGFSALQDFLGNILKDSNKADIFAPLFGDFEVRLGEKITALETLIEETSKTEAGDLGKRLAIVIENLRNDIKSAQRAALEEIAAGKTETLENSFKAEFSELRNDMINYHKSETEAIINSLDVKAETMAREALEKIELLISSANNFDIQNELMKELSDRVLGISSGLSALSTEGVKNAVQELSRTVDEISLSVSAFSTDDVKSAIQELSKTLDEISLSVSAFSTDDVKSAVQELSRTVDEISLSVSAFSTEDIKNIVDEISQTVEIILAKVQEKNDSALEISLSAINDNINNLQEGILASLGDQDKKIEDKFNLLSANNDILENNLNDTVQRTGSDLRSEIGSVKENLTSSNNQIREIVVENLTGIENSIAGINENIDDINSKINDFKPVENDVKKDELFLKLDETKEALAEIINSKDARAKGFILKFQECVNELKNAIEQNKAEILGAKESAEKSTERTIDEIKAELAELKSAIHDGFSNNENPRVLFDEVAHQIEEKIQNQAASLEAMVESSTEQINSKTSNIVEASGKDYSDKLDEKIQNITDKLRENFEAQGDLIRDEIRIKTDAAIRELAEKISKVESFLVKDENGENQEQGYTLADVESDIAKIRLGIEKSNKLSNFKEFASRLVELKNINLENAKISRVIGADIMRFDGWLKNTTAKIELLASKIEKSEKIKMEDLKSRIMQNEKAQTAPQKLEEAVMSIYKKYRIQETKIDEIISKIDNIPSSKSQDSFDVKEFIDLFYDNTQKTQNLISRMDGIEDKMDLIQAKIDHIISSCIDE